MVLTSESLTEWPLKLAVRSFLRRMFMLGWKADCPSKAKSPSSEFVIKKKNKGDKNQSAKTSGTLVWTITPSLPLCTLRGYYVRAALIPPAILLCRRIDSS